MKTSRAVYHGLSIGALFVFGSVLSAGPITWNFSNIVYGDGTTVTGSFVFDADTNTFSGLQATTSGGTSVPATSSWVFNTNGVLPTLNAGGQTGFNAVDVLSADETGAHDISLFSDLGPILTNAGGTITLDLFETGTCANAICFAVNPPISSTGSGQFSAAAAVPEPSTLIFSGSALILAVFRRRFGGRAE